MRSEIIKKINKIFKLYESKKIEKIDQEPQFLKSEVYRCTLNNGKIIIREKLIKNNSEGDAAYILPITKQGEVILAIEPRVFTKKTVGISLPAGYIDFGEDEITAASRELREETGYNAGKMISLGSCGQDVGCSSAYASLFLAMDCVKAGSQKLDNGEFIKYIKCTFNEVLELIDMGYIEDSNAIVTILRAKKYIKRRD